MKIFIIILISFFYIPVFSEQKVWDISGYFLTSAGILHFNEVDFSSKTLYLGRSTFRLNILNETAQSKLDFSSDFNIFYGLYNQLFKVNSDFAQTTENETFSIDIRKMYLMFNYNIVDFFIGRQLIKFGEGYIFTPLNPFSKIDFTDISFTRRGVDALRFKIYFTDKDCFESIFIPKTELSQSNFSTKFYSILFGLDLSFVGNYIGRFNWISTGFSFKGDAILGLYSEFLYNYTTKKDKRFFSYMIGADYSFKKKLIIRTEYTNNSYNIENFTQQEIIYLSNFPFVSQQYLALQTIYAPNIINSFNFSFITNLENLKKFLIFSYQRNLFSNLNIVATFRYIEKNFLEISSNMSSEAIMFLVDLTLRY